MEGSFSYGAYRDMLKLVDDVGGLLCREPRLGRPSTFMGVDIVPNSAFPMTLECKVCEGTGEGSESTYCPKCKGQGRNRYEGMMRNGAQTILLTVPLPKAFQPSFPHGMVALPPISRGLP